MGAEIKAKGGRAAADMSFVTKDMADAEKIVKSAVDQLGGVHILVNNAGILQDVCFKKQTDQQWSIIQEIHLYGQRNMIKACWAIFNEQKYGRVVNILPSTEWLVHTANQIILQRKLESLV